MKDILKVAIVDDEASSLSILSSAIKSTFYRYGYDIQLDSFNKLAHLARSMSEVEYSLLFLDIDMPGMDGIEFGVKLRGKKKKVDIIYVSQREDRVFDSFKVHPFGFVRKSNFINDISDVIALYIKTLGTAGSDNNIILRQKTGLITLNPREIVYIESDKRVQNVHLEKGSPLTVNYSMELFEKDLAPHGFMRIHKCFLVNYRFIRFIDSDDVVLASEERLAVSRRRMPEIKKQYLELMQNERSIVF